MKIDNIKSILRKNIGKEVSVAVVKGRHRYKINCCTIENVYPGIFVIKTIDKHTGNEKKMSYSYSDILTGTLVIRNFSTEEKAV